MVREDFFAKEEKRKITWTRYIVYINIAYHVIKVAVPASTLISCATLGVDDKECDDVTQHRIKIMLICDCTYACMLFFYEVFVVIRLIYFSWKYSRHEARQHMTYFVLNSIGLLTALPLVIDGLFVFIYSYDEYSDLRWIYYEDFVAKTVPSLIYILTKKNEDCFNCFNRLAP